MKPADRIRELFVADIMRDIPPAVYFHEQSPEKLAVEISEYMITGGHPDGHPGKLRIPAGIHEYYVTLLNAIADELDRPGGPVLPACWISGSFGSGKTSFAKFLGLALDGAKLPNGHSLAEALVARDVSPRRHELRDAWARLTTKIDPMAVLFDLDGVARDGEHFHSLAVRMVQQRLGYCTTDPRVADFELTLERDGDWRRFQVFTREALGRPWSEFKDKPFAEEQFSIGMHAMYPDRYDTPTSWLDRWVGREAPRPSPAAAVTAIGDMLNFRCSDRSPTLFLVADGASQVVLQNKDHADHLRAFASALGAGLHGRVWLVALGIEKLDETSEPFHVWARDRIPPKLRVHLANTNIRDVVHHRLLHKNHEADKLLRDLFAKHHADLKLFAYRCDSINADDFVEVYPLLPNYIDLIMRITSAVGTRSPLSQGDVQSIRSCSQLLGELFRHQRLADQPLGVLITLDQVYEVQHTALDAQTQASMARILGECVRDEAGLMLRAAKVVALLEQIQDEMNPTTAALVAQCLYDRLDRGSQVGPVTEALEELRRRNLLSYSEKLGYKLQSTAGEEWERERRDLALSAEALADAVQESLRLLLGNAERPRLRGRAVRWRAFYSDAQSQDLLLVDPREETIITVDFRFVALEERSEIIWTKRSSGHELQNRLLWVTASPLSAIDAVRDLGRSRAMIRRYDARRESLPTARRHLLDREKDRSEELERRLQSALADVFMAGTIFFRSNPLKPDDMGDSFLDALVAAGSRVLPEVYPYFITTSLTPGELLPLIEKNLSGPSPKLVHDLKILELDNGRYEPTCTGLVPSQVREKIEIDGGIGGTSLRAHFSGPPYGYTSNVIKACILGLLRAGKVRIQLESGDMLTGHGDTGARDLLEKDRIFRRATIYKAVDDGISPQIRAKIAKFFEMQFGVHVERDDNAIADVVANRFPNVARELREIEERLARLPVATDPPPALIVLQDALDACARVVRQTKPAVQQVKMHFDALRDGLQLLKAYQAELTDAAITAVRDAAQVRDQHGAQLRAVGALDAADEAALARIAALLVEARPWQGTAARAIDIAALRRAYTVERKRRLDQQRTLLERSRALIRLSVGFETLSADKSSRVLASFQAVPIETDAEALTPDLAALDATFQITLAKATEEARARVGELLHQEDRPILFTKSPRDDASRSVDVLIVTAIGLEFDAVLAVNQGAARGTQWEERKDPQGLRLASRSFITADEKTLHVAVAQAASMRADATVDRAGALLPVLRPRCLAMCGVCAGRPGKVNLGDVIASTLVWAYDHTAIVVKQGSSGPDVREALPETRTYNVSPQWTQLLERFSLPSDVEKRLQETRPHALLPQIDWLLLRVADGDNHPGKHPEALEYCPDYMLAVKEAWRSGDDQWLTDGKLKLTRAGKARVERLRILHAQGFPKLMKEAFKVRAAPIGTSNQLVRDEAVWDHLTYIHRDVAALEMEASAIGSVAERNGIQQWAVMKGVMDFAHRNKDDRFKHFAARASAEVLIDFLRRNLVGEVVGPVISTKPADARDLGSPLAPRIAEAHERGDIEAFKDLKRVERSGTILARNTILLGRYLLVDIIGSGGFADVWKARDLHNNSRIVAVKVLHGQYTRDTSMCERFRRGARNQAKLSHHPHIVPILDPMGEDAGFQFFVMEYIDGEDLERAAAAGLSPERVQRIISDIADALTAAHALQIVHRDVKPRNILLDKQGRSYLTDFDLVRAHDTTGGTRTGALGTFIYAAPEAMEMAKDADQRADVYGLGMTAVYALLSASRLPLLILKRPEEILGILVIPKVAQEVLAKSIEWVPANRFESVSDFAISLTNALSPTRPPSTLVAPGRDLPAHPAASPNMSVTPSLLVERAIFEAAVCRLSGANNVNDLRFEWQRVDGDESTVGANLELLRIAMFIREGVELSVYTMDCGWTTARDRIWHGWLDRLNEALGNLAGLVDPIHNRLRLRFVSVSDPESISQAMGGRPERGKYLLVFWPASTG